MSEGFALAPEGNLFHENKCQLAFIIYLGNLYLSTPLILASAHTLSFFPMRTQLFLLLFLPPSEHTKTQLYLLRSEL